MLAAVTKTHSFTSGQFASSQTKVLQKNLATNKNMMLWNNIAQSNADCNAHPEQRTKEGYVLYRMQLKETMLIAALNIANAKPKVVSVKLLRSSTI